MFHLVGKLIFQDFSKYETKLICCYLNLLYSTNGAKWSGWKNGVLFPDTTKVVSSNPTRVGCTQCKIM